MPDYYQTLGVPSTASAEQIKAAYRERAKHFHPDLHKNSEFFKKYFQDVQQAYEILSDVTSKSSYDRQYNSKTTNSNQDALAWEKTLQGLRTEITTLKNKVDSATTALEQKQRELETGKKNNDLLRTTLATVRQERDELKSKVETTKNPAPAENNNKVNATKGKAKTNHLYYYIGTILSLLALLYVVIFTDFFTHSTPKVNLSKQYEHIVNYEKLDYYSNDEYQEELISKADSVLRLSSSIDTSRSANIYNGKHIELSTFLTLRGHAKMEMGNDSGAIRDITLSIDKAKIASGYPHFLRAYIKLKMGDSAGALTDLDNAININPSYVQGLKLRAGIYFDYKEYAKALQDYQKIAAVDSQNAEAIAYMGHCHGWLGNYEMACQSYRRASDLGYSRAFEYIKQSCR